MRREQAYLQRGASVISGPELSGEPQEANVPTKRCLRGGGAPPSGADPDSASWEQRVMFRTMGVRPCARKKKRSEKGSYTLPFSKCSASHFCFYSTLFSFLSHFSNSFLFTSLLSASVPFALFSLSLSFFSSTFPSSLYLHPAIFPAGVCPRHLFPFF